MGAKQKKQLLRVRQEAAQLRKTTERLRKDRDRWRVVATDRFREFFRVHADELPHRPGVYRAYMDVDVRTVSRVTKDDQFDLAFLIANDLFLKLPFPDNSARGLMNLRASLNQPRRQS